MKKAMFPLCLILFFVSSFPLFSQSDLKPFVIKKNKVLYEGKRIANTKELRTIIRAGEDQEANHLVEKYAKTQSIGRGISIVGTGFVAVGLIITIQATGESDVWGISDKSSQGANFMLSGSALLCTGALVSFFAWKKNGIEAVKRYNYIIGEPNSSGTSLNIIPASQGLGLGFQLKF